MLELLERQTKLTGNQIRLLAVVIICNLLEFYDLFLVGFVLAYIAGPWKLTYGESAWMLLSSGLGAILGAGIWGFWLDPERSVVEKEEKVPVAAPVAAE